jgi:hypothetical protein
MTLEIDFLACAREQKFQTGNNHTATSGRIVPLAYPRIGSALQLSRVSGIFHTPTHGGLFN